MIDIVEIKLRGEPKGKGRPRFSRKTGHAYTPADTVSYENALRHEAVIAMGSNKPMEGPVHVRVYADFAMPKRFKAKERGQALAGTLRPTKKPDADNLMKCLDALNQVVFVDDKQIVEATVSKRYSDLPSLTVVVEPV